MSGVGQLARSLSLRPGGVDARRPAPFVVGAPRSGTTMLRMMVDAHPEFAIPPETYFLGEAHRAWTGARNGRRDPVEAFIRALTRYKRWPDFHLDAGEFADRVRERRPKRLGHALRCFYEMYAEQLGKPRWGDKTPFYVRRMKRINHYLPEARFIHVIRDGRAVAHSLKDLWFGPDTVERCAELWLARIADGRAAAPDLPHYIEISYEQLVTNPESQLRRIADFLDVDYAEEMTRYHEHAARRLALEPPPPELAENGRVVPTRERQRLFENVVRPPDPTRIDRWRQQMAPADIAAFEAIAGDRLRELGYPVG